MSDSVWTIKGATLSDKSARKEFDLTQDEIVKAIEKGKLECRINYMHGNPYLKLIRNEVEEFITDKYGKNHLNNKKLKNELNLVNKSVRKLKSELKCLEEKKKYLEEQISNNH